MRKIALLVALVATMLLPGLAWASSAANGPTGADAVSACVGSAGQVPQVGTRACRSVEQLARNTAQGCRRLDVGDETCSSIDGRHIDPAAINDFEASWVAKALALQRQLDDPLPLRSALLPHTHNSFNSAAYDPTLSRYDHNQVYSVDDQLRMGIRAIEIDVHWAPNAQADPAGTEAPTTCHAEPVATPVVVIHAGCTTEGTLRQALIGFRSWLADNPGQIVLLYLENNLDGRSDAHAAAAADIAATIGSLVYRPAGTCADLPVDMSRDAIRAAGKQVIITGNCGPGAWGTWVHPRGPHWDERSSGQGNDYPSTPDCTDRNAHEYDTSIIRIYEDSTWLSHMVAGSGSDVTPTEVASMVRCGVNLVGFDQLRPDDGRLAALVWSWAPNEPAVTSAAACAVRKSDGFHAAGCGEQHPFACVTPSGGWVVTATIGAWPAGPSACAVAGGSFAVPRTGRSDLALATAASGRTPWLSYAATGSGWTASGAF